VRPLIRRVTITLDALLPDLVSSSALVSPDTTAMALSVVQSTLVRPPPADALQTRPAVFTWARDRSRFYDIKMMTIYCINSIICFLILFLGLVVMGRHKCEVIACLSSQTQCELMNCYRPTVY